MKLENVHPGEILQRDFIEPLNVSVTKLAKVTRIEEPKLRKIINEEERITFNVAHGLSTYFGNELFFWLYAQQKYDNERSKKISAE